MPNLDYEREQLALADEHLAKLAAYIANMQASVEKRRALGLDPALSQRALAVAEETAEAFRAHRSLIAKIIADIEAGRLLSS